MRTFYGILITILLGLGGVLVSKNISIVQDFDLPESQYGQVSFPFSEGTLLFGGDVMLGRVVEDTMREKGLQFPFEKIRTLVQEADVSIANFEAAIPEKHQPTPDFNTRFSVDETLFYELANTGFDILSLSNNHTFDYGQEGYEHTKSVCARAQIECYGHPLDHSMSSITTTKIGDTTVGILMLHTLFDPLSATSTSVLIDALNISSDIQFVFIHWGEEYAPLHNESQEALAHFFIDNGIDAVIGHHPHVMQDIELYRGKPIFYSLGNLVFDQYFNTEVQEGYFVHVTLKKDEIVYHILPYDTLEERMQPDLKTAEESVTVYETFLRYPLFTREEIKDGSFSASR